MPHLIVDKDPCPCESGKLIKDCCLRPKDILRPRPFLPSTPAPKTGLSTPRCYAADLADCSEKISGEHYISHGILRELSEDGVAVEVEGLAWLGDDGKKKLPAKGLTSNILCKRHNEALSGLDSLAKRFFLSIDRIDKEFGSDISDGEDRVFLFNGHDVERWMLKTLCGMVFSGSASTQIAPIRGWKPNTLWVKILFGKERFPNKWGIYFSGNIGEVSVTNRGFAFNPVSNDALGVYGSITTLNGKRFILAMATPPADRNNTILANYIYRPDELVMSNGRCEKVIKFGWDVRGRGGSIGINYDKKL
jgi:hypothetical protein